MILYNDTFTETSMNEQHLNDGFCIYEVIRIFQGKPIFLQDNINRLQSSIRQSDFPFEINSEHLRSKITSFIQAIKLTNGNIKYALLLNHEQKVEEFIYQIPHAYPTLEQYAHGVSTITLRAERKNPNVKYINNVLREEANALIKKYQVYEVLLVNSHEQLTEGSRSNLFFIKGNALYTASLDQVLPGTSRMRVIQVCQQHNIPVIETAIHLNEIQTYPAAFLSGTSPLILPIHSINECNFDVNNEVLRHVMQIYFEYIEKNG